VPRWLGFEAFTNAPGVLFHGAALDPGVEYPPDTKNHGAHEVIEKLMP
jgi:aldehyde dehydrogenase (NAD+)